jgi:hypothetical protein
MKIKDLQDILIEVFELRKLDLPKDSTIGEYFDIVEVDFDNEENLKVLTGDGSEFELIINKI